MRANCLKRGAVVTRCLSAITLVVGFAGCAIIGPRSITAGRMAYAEAITSTSDEQMLQMIVRYRYGLHLSPLAVSGVTANVRIETNAGVNVGIGSSSAYQGNLVPLSAGVAYEENPIISYAPIDNSAYLSQFLSPVPLEMALLLMRSAEDRSLTCFMLLERINGLKNTSRSEADDAMASFVRAVEIIAGFFESDLAEFVSLGERQFGMLIQVEEIRGQQRTPELIELMRLLELNDLLGEARWTGQLPTGRIAGQNQPESSDDVAADQPPKSTDDEDQDEGGLAGADADAVERSEREVLVISLRFSAVSDGSSLALTTRSLFDMVRIAADSIDVPEEHIVRGLTAESRIHGLPGSLIRIHRSKDRPADAAVATRLYDWWYYIDASDTRSKWYFTTLSSLWSAQIASADQGTRTPLLTVPVSR
jgi:hypothetical protein